VASPVRVTDVVFVVVVVGLPKVDVFERCTSYPVTVPDPPEVGDQFTVTDEPFTVVPIVVGTAGT
jgi:hypothetical protein